MVQFKPYSIALPDGRLYDIDRPLVMGIVNVTPDSFYHGSRVNTAEDTAKRTREMIEQGADIIDIGACSTRPGAVFADEGEEMRRLESAMPSVLETMADYQNVLLSVDTFRASVARKAVEQWGAAIVNDITGGSLDSGLWDTVRQLRVPYVLTHYPTDNNGKTVAEVLEKMARDLDTLRQRGVNDVIVDPGFGFGKDIDENFAIMRELEAFHALEAPLMVGVSRKRMVWQALGISSDEALNGTTVLNTVALISGAHILRVHDVPQAREAVELTRHLTRQ